MINLLPLQQKKENEKEKKKNLILILEIMFLIFLVYLFLVFLAIKIYIGAELILEKKFLETERQKFETPELQDFRLKMTELNQNFLKLSRFYEDKIELAQKLENLSASLPSEAYLNRFFWQRENNQAVIHGFSPLRENLFELRENLEMHFKEVHFPASNWVKPKDVSFEATFKIKNP